MYFTDNMQLKSYRKEVTVVIEEGELIGIIPNPDDQGKIQSLIPKKEEDSPKPEFKWKIPYGFHGGKKKKKKGKKKDK